MSLNPSRPLYCSCRGEHPGPIHECRVHGTYETDITRANNLIGQWANIAAGIARQCKWRARGQCLTDCPGLAVCNLDGLTLVNHQGQPVRPRTRNPEPRTRP